MAVTFVSRFHMKPLAQNGEGKFYPAVSYIAEIGVDKLAQDISESTTLTPTEVIGVIQSLLVTIPKYMMLGYKVRLDSFGIFKLGMSGTVGHAEAKDVSANDIRGLKILFHPDPQFKARLRNPEFVKLDPKAKGGDGQDGSASQDPAGDGGSPGSGDGAGNAEGGGGLDD